MDRRPLGVAIASLIAACSAAWIATLPACASSASKPAESAVSDGTEFHERILSIAREYRSFPRVSDRTEWAPGLCFVPPPMSHHSESGDASTHGRKLYLLYAKDGGEYTTMSHWGTGSLPYSEVDYQKWRQNPEEYERAELQYQREHAYVNPTGQWVVKESFVPVEFVENAVFTVPYAEPDRVSDNSLHPEKLTAISEDGKKFAIGDPAGLFIMLKLDPATPNTDEGWVYAVTTPDNASVIRAGRIESCIDCHKTTTKDRLYGFRWSWGVSDSN